MNFSELKEKVKLLSFGERRQLFAFLADLEGQDESAFRAVIKRHMQTMDARRKVTAEDLAAMHQKLQ